MLGLAVATQRHLSPAWASVTYATPSLCLGKSTLAVFDVKVKAFVFLAQFELNSSAGAPYPSAHYSISLSKHPEPLSSSLIGSRQQEPRRLNSNIVFELPSPWMP